MTRIIGIDPGSRRTGFGIIDVKGYRYLYVASGFIDVQKEPMSVRLQKIHIAIKNCIDLYQPEEAAIEDVFMHENVRGALKLGQARGAAIAALSTAVSEYSPRQIKKSVVGYGAADKSQVQMMVARLLNIQKPLQPDEADALAIALCHAQSRVVNQLLKCEN